MAELIDPEALEEWNTSFKRGGYPALSQVEATILASLLYVDKAQMFGGTLNADLLVKATDLSPAQVIYGLRFLERHEFIEGMPNQAGGSLLDLSDDEVHTLITELSSYYAS